MEGVLCVLGESVQVFVLNHSLLSETEVRVLLSHAALSPDDTDRVSANVCAFVCLCACA